MEKSRIYLGAGKQVQDFDMVNITIDATKIQQHIYEYEGGTYLSLTVAKRMTPDKFGKTHTCYIDQLPKPEPAPKGRKRNSKK